MPQPPDWKLIDRFLAGDASPEEARAVQEWTAGDPSAAALLDRLRARLAAPGSDERWDTDEAWARVAARMAAGAPVVSLDERRARGAGAPPTPTLTPVATAPRRTSSALAWRVAAGLLVAAAGLGTWRALATREPAAVTEASATRVAEAPRGRPGVAVDLPDGSRVMLHAGSRVRWAPTLGAADAPRDVWLEGEGYFEVTHDARRPFRVHARDALAEDLGTKFVVRAYPESEGVDVAVTEGLVSLRRQPPAGGRAAGDSALIRPGQRGRLPAGSGAPTVEPAGDLARFVGWTAGTLALDGGTLAEALPRFERWYDVDVVLADRRLGARTVVARFRNEPLSQAVDELAIALGARVSRAGRTVTFHAKE